MKLNRRASVRILAAAAATPVLVAQTLAPPAQTASPELQSARNGLQENARRIARVKLPRSTEPAFRFRA
jgi:hypothetical protein